MLTRRARSQNKPKSFRETRTSRASLSKLPRAATEENRRHQSEVHAARLQAHVHFDRLWDRGPCHLRHVKRQRAYRWLCDLFGMSRREAHIRYFDIGMCEALIEKCLEVQAGIFPGP